MNKRKKCFSTINIVVLLLTLSFSVHAQNAQDLFTKGSVALGKGEYARAIAALKEVVESDTVLRPRAYGQLGIAYQAIKEYDLASAAYKKTIELGFSVQSYSLRLADVLVTLNRVDEASPIIRAALERNPADGQIKMLYIRLLAGQGKLTEAEQMLKSIVSLNPNDASAVAELIRLSLQTQGLEEAKRLVFSAGEMTKRILPAAMDVASALVQAGKDSEAEEIYARLMSADPLSAGPFIETAKIFLRTGRDEKIQEILPDFKKTANTVLQQYVGIGQQLDDRQKASEAEALLKAIIKAQPDFYPASAQLATLQLNHGRVNRALEAIDMVPTDYRRWFVPDPDWNYVASKVYSKLRDYSTTKDLSARAVEQLREELKKDPANALAYAKTGLCSLLMEDLSGAEGEFQKFINRTRPEERSSVVKELQVLISQQIVQDDAKYILTKYFSQAGTEKKEERIDSLPVTVTSRDTVAPKIVILEPKDVRGMKVLDAGKYSLAVSGFVSDANGVSVVYVNGIVASMSAPTTTEAGASGLAGKILKFSADVMSPVGESIVDVRAVDLYGNQGKSTFKIRRDAPAAIASTDDKPTQPRLKLPAIWAVVIGISEYQNKELQLSYAHKDAEAYYSFLKSPFGGAIQEDRIEILTNRNATRADIIRALNEKLRMAFEDDMVIIYIASHGVPEEVSGELYFLGYDADTKNIAGTAISQIDVQKAIATARAKKILLIADACHSGSVGLSPSIARRGSVATYVNRLLKEIAASRDGVAILTASSANEFSQEGSQWGGHGVFTHHLINGLKGQADSDGDGYVTVREVYEYVYRKVADDTGGKQHPDLQGKFDNKLPVGVVK